MSFFRKLSEKVYIPLAWTIFIQILLCLPGSAIPEASRFQFLNIDKIVHTVIFGTFVFLWCLYFSRKIRLHEKLKMIFFTIFLIAAFNGIAIEYIQKYFIPNRSFDQADIIVDLLGSSIVYGICNVKLLTCISGRSSTSG